MFGSGKRRSGGAEAASFGECSLTSPDSEMEPWARLQGQTEVTQRLKEGLGHSQEDLKAEKSLF